MPRTDPSGHLPDERSRMIRSGLDRVNWSGRPTRHTRACSGLRGLTPSRTISGHSSHERSAHVLTSSPHHHQQG